MSLDTAYIFTNINQRRNKMKYAWYTKRPNEDKRLITIENRPMDINDAVKLTKHTKATTAYSYPAFKTKKINASNIDYNNDFNIDKLHSIFDEITFESYNNLETNKTESYMVIEDEELNDKFEIPETIKNLYNSVIKYIYATTWSVTFTAKDKNNKWEKFMLSKGRNFENKSITKKYNIAEEDYTELKKFSEKLVHDKERKGYIF